MAGHQRPASREDFGVALICALPLEFDVICMVVDEFWGDEGDEYGKTSKDRNTYYTGRIGRHNAVIALIGMGKINSATAASNLRSSYPNIRLAILVGVCGGIPLIGQERVCLGDVVISDTMVQYDFGRQIDHEFIRKKTSDGNSGSAPRDVVNLIDTLKTFFGRRRLLKRTKVFIGELEVAAASNGQAGRYRKPDDVVDGQILGNQVDEDTSKVPSPVIHFGPMASGDTVMHSAERRDHIVKGEGVIAFEMEGAGIWQELPCIVVKGVADFSDREKTKDWQDYAAAMAAATSKTILERYIQIDRPPAPPISQPLAAKQYGSNYSGTIEAKGEVDQGNKMRASSSQPPRNYEQEGSTFAVDINSGKSVKQGNVMEFF
ncbi:MTA/SAH nucleosidase [Fusarium austroafricanum]|uniref:MTA/SAH nucleosidase n=1 Tax=Fusarium austroafricanum TaxID=2364996 RepID=A0A8H4K521_9HYPO|nr:MTA/SAH nucleosidase [Fusarium austroafricanum]